MSNNFYTNIGSGREGGGVGVREGAVSPGPSKFNKLMVS